MNLGEIRVFRFKRAQSGAEAIPANLGIDASAQLVIVDEKMPINLDVFVAIVHVRYRKAPYQRLSKLACTATPMLPDTSARAILMEGNHVRHRRAYAEAVQHCNLDRTSRWMASRVTFKTLKTPLSGCVSVG